MVTGNKLPFVWPYIISILNILLPLIPYIITYKHVHVSFASVVWIYSTFENNLEVAHKLEKYLQTALKIKKASSSSSSIYGLL